MKGVSLDLTKINGRSKLDTSFRLLLLYIPTVDGFGVRLDAKINKTQYHVGLNGVIAKDPDPEVPIQETDDLVMPKKAAEGINLKVNRVELIAALRELASDLENTE